MQPRFSVIIPILNGERFLSQILPTVTSFMPEDAEVIISDALSTDRSPEIAREFSRFPRVSFISVEEHMSMADHWDFAASSALGEWQMFLGQDDFVQSYFWDEVRRVALLAERMGVRAFTARRALAFWEGMGSAYEGMRARFDAQSRVSMRDARFDAFLACLNIRSYHHLPQMYTSSFFHADLLGDIRAKNGGRLFHTHPQDASLAGAFCAIESRYLRSELPFSWVGTSGASAGLKVVTDAHSNHKNSAANSEAYLKSVAASRQILYPEWAGPFSLGENAIYFWQSIASAVQELDNAFARILKSTIFRFFAIASVWSRPEIHGASVQKRNALRGLSKKLRLSPAATEGFGLLVGNLVQMVLDLRSNYRKLEKHWASLRGKKTRVRMGFDLSTQDFPALEVDELNLMSEAIYLSMVSPKS